MMQAEYGGLLPDRCNYLINGNFDIWQRGTAFTNPSAAYTTDRWLQYMGAAGGSVERSTDAPAGSRYSMRIICNGSVSGYTARQIIEDYWALAGKTVTFSYMIKGPVGVSVNSDITSDVSGVTFVTTVMTGEWQKIAVTANIPINAAQVYVGACRAISAPGTFYVAQAQLVIGSTAPPYIPRPYAQELALCQRYFETTRDTSGYMVLMHKYANDGEYGYFDAPIGFLVQKRIPPTMIYSATTSDMCTWRAGALNGGGSIYHTESTTRSNRTVLRATNALALAIGAAGVITVNPGHYWAADAEIYQ